MIETTVEDIHGEGGLVRRHQTDSGIPLREAYGPLDAPSERSPAGAFPFTRGNNAGGYRQELWHRDLYAGFGNVEDARSRYVDLLAGGASGVNMAFDLPTQLGYDSDDPEAIAEVGRVGIALDSLQDILDLFDGLDLARAKTLFTVGNGIGAIAYSWFTLLAENRGVADKDYVVHLQNDPLKEFTGRGAFIFPVEAHVRMAVDVVEHVARLGNMHWKPIGICGSQYRWGGASAVQEIAFAIAQARVYIDELLARGLDIDDFAPLLELHLTSDIDVLEEVAKFRAARTAWALMMRDTYGAKKPESQKLRISLYTAGYRLTAQEPLNNAVRVTLQALAAVLGGVEHLGTLSIDEALATPTPETSRLAAQTQNILAFETSIPSSADPLGGSWLIESLTDEMLRRIDNEVSLIEKQGGSIAALKSGYLQQVIRDGAYQFQREVDSGERVVAGLNHFVGPKAKSAIKPFQMATGAQQRQAERLRSLRASRDPVAVERALDNLQEQAQGSGNLVEPIKSACSAMATTGEIHKRLREVFGDWESGDVVL